MTDQHEASKVLGGRMRQQKTLRTQTHFKVIKQCVGGSAERRAHSHPVGLRINRYRISEKQLGNTPERS